MVKRSGAVHVVTTSRKYKDKVYQAHLLRRSYREDGKVKNETIANLSHLPATVIDVIRRSLRGEQLVNVDDLFEVDASYQHGHVQAIQAAFRSLGMEKLIAAKKCKERDVVLALIAARIIKPDSKLATTRWWHCTTIPEEFGVGDCSEDDLYAAMDWLLKRQPTIEKKLASRHLHEGGLVLYDLSSSYFEGRCCPLASRGYSRDRKRGTLQVNYGLMTDGQGCPVSVSVFPGNTGDSSTFVAEVDKVRDRFNIESMVVVGDRGMISQKQIDQLSKRDGVDWVSALKSPAIRKLFERGAIQLGLFDERNLFEIDHPDRPGERLVACRNPELADYRKATRQGLLDATVAKLEKIRESIAAGRLRGEGEIGVKVGKVVNSRKIGKHFDLDISDTSFHFTINEERVEAEAALDGVYVVRTSVPSKTLDSQGVVATYKQLSRVERAFRSLKTVDLHVRPIRHWNEGRVRAHIFLCVLTYYVQFHLQEAWRSLLFADEEAGMRERKDIVAPVQRSASASTKASTKTTPDGQPAHSFKTLIAELGRIVRNRCRRKEASQGESPVLMTTNASALQQKALDIAATAAM